MESDVYERNPSRINCGALTFAERKRITVTRS